MSAGAYYFVYVAENKHVAEFSTDISGFE